MAARQRGGQHCTWHGAPQVMQQRTWGLEHSAALAGSTCRCCVPNLTAFECPCCGPACLLASYLSSCASPLSLPQGRVSGQPGGAGPPAALPQPASEDAAGQPGQHGAPGRQGGAGSGRDNSSASWLGALTCCAAATAKPAVLQPLPSMLPCYNYQAHCAGLCSTQPAVHAAATTQPRCAGAARGGAAAAVRRHPRAAGRGGACGREERAHVEPH